MFEGEDSKLAHPKGYFQPGVLCLDANQRVLYRWRSIPTRKNIGGAVERPTPEHVYKQLTKSLELPLETGDAQLDSHPELDSRGPPFPLFLLLLLANGWFVKPRTFLLTNSEIPVQRRLRNAAIRIPFFIAAWVLALVMLPGFWVGLAAIAYGLWLIPHFQLFIRQFQNMKAPDS